MPNNKNFDINLGVIDPKSISFAKIREDLISYAETLPDGAKWKDFFEHSDGTIIAEWIAGLGALKTYHEIMRIRESSLDFAQLDSSVFHLAFNKGLLIEPAKTAELELTIETLTPTVFDEGELIGNLSDYDVISLSSTTITGRGSITAVVGRQQVVEENIPELNDFQEFEYIFTDTFIGSQLEEFLIDDTDNIELMSDPDFLREADNNFVLRRVIPGTVKIYIGNGVLGWIKPDAKKVKYSCLTYDTDITLKLEDNFRIIGDWSLISQEITSQPIFGPSKEEVRGIARYYPIDGRIIQDSDYEVVIIKFFGGVLSDVYSFNTDPNQEVHILKSNTFGDGALEEDTLDEIKKLIDSKRGNGIQVLYTLYEESAGLVWNPSFRVTESEFSPQIVEQVNSFLRKEVFKFSKEVKIWTAVDLAIILTNNFNTKFFPIDINDSITLNEVDFFRSFEANITSIQ